MIDWKDWIAASASEADSLASFDIAKSTMSEREMLRACYALDGFFSNSNVFLNVLRGRGGNISPSCLIKLQVQYGRYVVKEWAIRALY